MLDRFTGAEGQNLALAALRDQPTIGGDAILAETVLTSAEIVGFNPGAILIEESAPDNDMYFILAGKVSIKVHGREVAVRTAGQHIGEMAMLDPSQRRSASAIAMEEAVVARLSATSFIKIADGNPRLWRNIARELADRLRQRNRYVNHPNAIPTLFVGCSAEALDIARAIQSGLAHDPVIVHVWTDGIMKTSNSTIESLEAELHKFDFAALVLTGEDEVSSRSVTSNAPRDNIIFELGLFMGALGRSRTFVVQPRGAALKVPSDLMGITPLTYEAGLSDDLPTLVAPVCNEIRSTVLAVGSH